MVEGVNLTRMIAQEEAIAVDAVEVFLGALSTVVCTSAFQIS